MINECQHATPTPKLTQLEMFQDHFYNIVHSVAQKVVMNINHKHHFTLNHFTISIGAVVPEVMF